MKPPIEKPAFMGVTELKSVVEHKVEADSKTGYNRRAASTMDFCDVIDGIDVVRVSGRTDPQVLSVAYDSRRVTPGALVFCAARRKGRWRAIRR